MVPRTSSKECCVLQMTLLIKNVKGSSGSKLPNNMSWLAGYMGCLELQHQPVRCSNLDCSRRSNRIIGCHVTQVNVSKTQYIVPLCDICNNVSNTDIMRISEEATPLVPVVLGIRKRYKNINHRKTTNR